MTECSKCKGRGLIHPGTEPHKKCDNCAVCPECSGTGREGGQVTLYNPGKGKQARGIAAMCTVL